MTRLLVKALAVLATVEPFLQGANALHIPRQAQDIGIITAADDGASIPVETGYPTLSGTEVSVGDGEITDESAQPTTTATSTSEVEDGGEGNVIINPLATEDTPSRVKRDWQTNPYQHNPVWTPASYYDVIRSTGAHTAFLPWASWDSEAGTSFPPWKTVGGKGPTMQFVLGPASTSCPSCPTAFPTITQSAMIDTGSVAIIVGPKFIGGIDNAAALDPNNEPGWQYFPYMKKLILGKWVKLEVTLQNGNPGDNNVVKATPSVLVATYLKTDCTFTPGDWTAAMTKCMDPVDPSPASNTWGPTRNFIPYFGMGWGQYSDIRVDAQFARKVNKVNGVAVSTHVPGVWNPGYVIGKQGIQFGLTHKDKCWYHYLPASSFNEDDATRPGGCIQIGSGACQQGEFLPDTGVESILPVIGTPFSYPTAGAAFAKPSALAEGVKVDLWLAFKVPATTKLSLGLTAGEPKATPNPGISGAFTPKGFIHPGAVNQPYSTYGSYVNTGRSFFNAMDMCWDIKFRRAGFRDSQPLPWPGT